MLNGPPELRRGVQQSVLQWHFKADAAGSTRVVNISFQAPTQQAPVAGGNSVVTIQAARDQSLQEAARRPVGISPAPVATPAAPVTRTLKSISVVGLSDSVRSDLLAKLPVREGDTMNTEAMGKLSSAVAAFDEHLRVSYAPAGSEVMVVISAPDAASETPSKIRIGGNVQQTKLVTQPHPTYPADAKAARIQGTVKLQATIGFDGTVKSLEVISGHPLLVPAALDAVKQWVYQPTLLNGNPVEVLTQIDVNFTLSQ
jgi:TonB family protein